MLLPLQTPFANCDVGVETSRHTVHELLLANAFEKLRVDVAESLMPQRVVGLLAGDVDVLQTNLLGSTKKLIKLAILDSSSKDMVFQCLHETLRLVEVYMERLGRSFAH
jgi:hypothetical protein